MNKQQIETRLFQKSAHIKEGLNSLENWNYFREHGGVKSQKVHIQDWLINHEEVVIKSRLESPLDSLLPISRNRCSSLI